MYIQPLSRSNAQSLDESLFTPTFSDSQIEKAATYLREKLNPELELIDRTKLTIQEATDLYKRENGLK